MGIAHLGTNKEIIWHTDVLPVATHRALRFLARQEWLKRSRWYLAGGTALALHVGHRTSVDLDFFIPKSTFTPAEVLKHLPKKDWKVTLAKEGTIFGKLLGAKVSFIAYPFFIPAHKPSSFGHVRILTPADIAVMKVIAISQRGRKRDFLDLYWYCNNRELLADVIRRLPDQYPTVTHNYSHVIKSLMYFADAEEDPMPPVFFPVTWEQIKKYFQREVPRAAKKFLHLE